MHHSKPIILGLAVLSSAAPHSGSSPRSRTPSTVPGKVTLFSEPKCPSPSILSHRRTQTLEPNQSCQPLSPSQTTESLSIISQARCPDPENPTSLIDADILLFATADCSGRWIRRIPGHLLPLIQSETHQPLCISRTGYLPGSEVKGIQFSCPEPELDVLEEEIFDTTTNKVDRPHDGERESNVFGSPDGQEPQQSWLDAAIDEMNTHASDDDEPEPGPGDAENADPDYGPKAEERWRDIPVVIVAGPPADGKGEGGGGVYRLVSAAAEETEPDTPLPGKEPKGSGGHGGAVPWIVILLVVVALLVSDILKLNRVFNGILAAIRRRRGEIALE